MTIAAHNTNNPANTSVTDKSIHLLNKCLDHQRHRFDHARLKAHHSALVLRAQSQQLDGLNSAISDYRLGNKNMIPIETGNITSFKRLLQDVRDLQKNQVDREEHVYQCCQQEALTAQQKVKTMEKLLEKLHSRLHQQAIKKEPNHLDDQVCSSISRNLH